MRRFGLLAALTLGCMLTFSAVAMAATQEPVTTDPASQGITTNGTGVDTADKAYDGTTFSGQSYRMTPNGGTGSTAGNNGTSYDSPTADQLAAAGAMKYDSPNNQKVHSSYSKTSDACASCHTVHNSVNQGALLQWEDPQTACWACHDGTVASTYNVITGTHNDKTGKTGTQVNSAGLFGVGNEAGLSNHGMSPKEPAFVTTAAAPGGSENETLKDKNGDWSTEFSCVACHDPHGTLGNARILNPNVNGYADRARATMGTGEILTTNDNKIYQAKAGMWMSGHGFDATVTVTPAPDPSISYKLDVFNGRVIFDSALPNNSVVKALYSPGLVVKMDVQGKLTTSETVKYQSGINQFCGACHTDYNNEGKTKGANGVGGAYNLLLGEYRQAYRHSVGFTRTVDPKDKNFTNANSLDANYPGLKFDTSNPKAPGTVLPTVDCLTCHYAHGTSDDFITKSLTNLGQLDVFAVGGKDVNGNPLNAYGDKAIQTYDTSRTTALKRLPNMGVCQACHNKTGVAIAVPTTTQVVNDAVELAAALTNDSITDIQFGKSFESLDPVIVSRAVNIDGNGKTLTLNNTTSGSNSTTGLGLNSATIVKNLTVTSKDSAGNSVLQDNLVEVYGGKVVLQNVSISGSKQAGLLVGDGGNVTVQGNITLSKNTWGGIEVKNSPNTSLTFADKATLSYTVGSKANAPVVWIDAVVTPTDYVTDTADVLADPVYSNGTTVTDYATATQIWWQKK